MVPAAAELLARACYGVPFEALWPEALEDLLEIASFTATEFRLELQAQQASE